MALLAQQFAAVATKNLSKAAFHYLGKDISFEEARTRVARLSYLYHHEIGSNTRVAFLATQHPILAITFLALSNTRATLIPLDPAWSQEEMIQTLKESRATHLAVTSDMTSVARDLLQESRLGLPLIEIERKQGGEYDTAYSPPSDNAPNDADPVLLLRTGGLKPKLVSFSHKQFQNLAISLRGKYHLLANDRFLTTMSWAHPFAFVHGMIFPLLSGATVVIHHGLEKREFLDDLVSARVTRLVGPPSFFLKLLMTCKNEKRTLPGTRSVTVGLGPLSPEVQKAFSILKIPVAHCYGQTEALWTIVMQDIEKTDAPDECVGHSLPGFKYKVMDEAGDEIPGFKERTGLLAISSTSVMTGYPGKEQETKQAIRGSWLYTGDIVTLEGDGEELSMRFLGRMDDVLIVDGKMHSLRPIDAAIRTIPGTHDAGTFILKNAAGKLVLLCAIVKTPGNAASDLNYLNSCSEKLTTALLPKMAIFTDSIPRDAAGNVNRARLRAQFSGVAG